ncbi:unnamed protein product [Auanema sp. JU1783]|nr:unnamed protein product [Auanema sp. JU1783]
MTDKKFKTDLFGTFRHASYSVQKNEPNGPSEPPATTYPSTPLMGGPSKEDKKNLKDYPLTPDKATGGKSHGSYDLVESNKVPEKKMSTGVKLFLATTCVCFLILFLLVGVWLALHLGAGDCKGNNCNATVEYSNQTERLMISNIPLTDSDDSSDLDLDLEETLSLSSNDLVYDGSSGTVTLGNEAVVTLNCFSRFTDEDVASYKAYVSTAEKSFSDDKSQCESVERFLASKKQIAFLNEKFKPNVEFGLTVFTDWTEVKRTEMGTESTTSNDFEEKAIRIENPDISDVNYLRNTYGVEFNDSCSPKLNIRKALRRISQSIKKNIMPRDLPKEDSVGCGVDEGVYQIVVNTGDDEKDRENFTNWLLTRGPFVTNLIVPDSFFDYKNGTFSAEMCAKDFTTMVYVIVVGNGEREDKKTNTKVRFWHIMPIGEIWKDWGNGGYMRLDVNACIPPNRNGKLIAYLD